MEIGDIVFFKSKTTVGKVVSFFTDSPYSHVALVVGENEIIEADRFIKVRTRVLTDDEIVYVKEIGKHLSSEQKEELVAASKFYLNRGYDYKMVWNWFLRLAFNVDLKFVDNANTLLCSELIDRSFMAIDIDLVPEREEGDVTPFHLLTFNTEKLRGDS